MFVPWLVGSAGLAVACLAALDLCGRVWVAERGLAGYPQVALAVPTGAVEEDVMKMLGPARPAGARARPEPRAMRVSYWGTIRGTRGWKGVTLPRPRRPVEDSVHIYLLLAPQSYYVYIYVDHRRVVRAVYVLPDYVEQMMPKEYWDEVRRARQEPR
jgi:hypothetical protein